MRSYLVTHTPPQPRPTQTLTPAFTKYSQTNLPICQFYDAFNQLTPLIVNGIFPNVMSTWTMF